MSRPLVVVMDPQHDDRMLEETLGQGAFAFEFVPYPIPGAPVDPAVLARADAWLNYRGRHRLPAEVLRQMARCRIIVNSGVGYDHVDVRTAAELGIPVCNVPDYGTTEVADHAIALTLTLCRGIVGYDRTLRTAGGWEALGMPGVRRIRGLRFGVVGLGRIGLATARRAEAFGMSVQFFDPHLPVGTELAHGYRRFDTLDGLLAETDVLSLHTPLTVETQAMIGAAALSRLPPGAVLINTSRGRVVQLDAVEAALRDGRLAGAGLDVLEQEPPDFAHPLLAAWRADEGWLRNRLIVTPHAAFFTPESVEDKRRLTTTTALDYLRAGTLRACVNLDLLRTRRGPAGG
jgi:lactate dehydrogenase-like 2-hydroxyacid dehydrogenase